MPRPKYWTTGQMWLCRVLLQHLQEEIAVRDVFGLRPSKNVQRSACQCGVVASAIQIGNCLFLMRDVALTIADRFLSNRQVV